MSINATAAAAAPKNGNHMSKLSLTIVSLLWAAAAGAAPPEGRAQYITDEVAATLREQPKGDATIKGQLRSGTRITVLETLGPDSFTHVRTDEGKEGWIPSRFVSAEPAAKDRLAPLQQDLAQARERIKTLERDLAAARDSLAKAAPALELAQDNEKLRATIAEKEQAGVDLQRRYGEEDARRKTLLMGAGLVGAGVALGLLLPLLGRRQKRRGGF